MAIPLAEAERQRVEFENRRRQLDEEKRRAEEQRRLSQLSLGFGSSTVTTPATIQQNPLSLFPRAAALPFQAVEETALSLLQALPQINLPGGEQRRAALRRIFPFLPSREEEQAIGGGSRAILGRALTQSIPETVGQLAAQQERRSLTTQVAAGFIPVGRPFKIAAKVFEVRGTVATPASPAVHKMITMLNQTKLVQRSVEKEVTEELGKRAAKSMEVFQEARESGELVTREVFQRALGPLKGELPKGEFPSLLATFTPTEQSELLGLILNHSNNSFDIINASKAFDKLMFGAIPQRAEIARLEGIFGSDMVQAILAQRSRGEKAWETTRDVLQIPRSVLSSYDISAPFRQGLVLGVRHPKEAGGAFNGMIKSLLSEEGLARVERSIRGNKAYALLVKAGVDITPMTGKVASASLREEAFMSNLARRIPGIRVSERAYVGYLNKLRADVFYKYANEWAGTGKTLNDYKELAKFINWSTGRGPLPGVLKGSADLMNATFFSPRLITSRFALPVSLFSSSKAARKVAAESLAVYVGGGIGILSLVGLAIKAKMPGTENMSVETDPRSSDFGKIRIGPTRIDFWAGAQPIVRYTAQFITDQRKATGTKRVTPIDNRFGTVARFLQSKLNPPVGFGVDVLRGETFLGQEVFTGAENLPEQAFNRLAPLFIQDLAEAINIQGLTGGVLATGGLVGIGIQSYDDVASVRNRISVDVYGKPFDLLNQAERRFISAAPQVQLMIKKREEKRRPELAAQTAFRNLERFKTRKAELEVSLKEKIDAGLTGLPLREAIREFKRDRFMAAETLITPEVEEAISPLSQSPEDSLAEQYYNIELPEDPATGELDFTAFENAREALLREAEPVLESVGLTREYITGVGQDTFRGKRFEDPDVQRVVEDFERDMQSLRDYWNVPERVIRDPNLLRQYRLRRLVPSVRKSARLKRAIRLVNEERIRLRKRSRKLDSILLKWGFVSTPVRDRR